MMRGRYVKIFDSAFGTGVGAAAGGIGAGTCGGCQASGGAGCTWTCGGCQDGTPCGIGGDANCGAGAAVGIGHAGICGAPGSAGAWPVAADGAALFAAGVACCNSLS